MGRVLLFVVDNRLAGWLERPDRQPVRGRAVPVGADLWPAQGQRGSASTVDAVARPLWGSEIATLVGKPVGRA